MNKKQLFIKLLLIVVGGIAVFLLSSCLTSLRILSCKKSCVESCNSSSEIDVSGHEYGIYYILSDDGESYLVYEVGYKETSVEIPETYEGLPVEGIASGAFTHYSYTGCGGSVMSAHLSSLILPETIKWIGEGVFSNGGVYYRYGDGATCDKLIFKGSIADWCNISFGSSPFSAETKFYIGDEQVIDLEIPEEVTTIRENVFAYYAGLKSVTFHENITTIEDGAFLGCHGLKELAFPCKELTIGMSAFSTCYGVETITFTGEKLVLGNQAFSTCISLKEVNWNAVNITAIPEYAFFSCTALEEFVIPATVESIKSKAFADCYNLIEVFNLSKLEITAGSSSHGEVAYYAGVVHTAEEDDSHIVTEGDYKFVVSSEKATLFKYTGNSAVLILPELESGYDIRANTFYYNNDIQSVNIPDCVTAIGERAFYSCENLQIVTGCNGLTSVGEWAFKWCISLQSIKLSSVEEIGDGAFGNCVALKSITLPESLTKIGKDAFTDCSATITYAGTLEEWQQVELSENALNEVTVTCSDGEVWEGKI